MKISRKNIILYLPFCILLLIATLEFFLLLRHKSPYLSDSYFYKHIFYEMQGDSFDTARQKIVAQVDFQKADDITKNFFLNQDKYRYSLSRYRRRPLYPLTAYLINLFITNEYWAFIIPIFVSYVGSIALIYFLFRYRFDSFWASFGTALFIGFNPFIDWSTYFLTDTIGAFFWLLQIYLIFKLVQKPSKIVFAAYMLSLIVSLFNREQSLLMVIVILIVLLLCRMFKLNKGFFPSLYKIKRVSIGIAVAYLIINAILKQPNLYDSWIYLQSSFGYYDKQYTLTETISFLFFELIELHKGLIMDLIRHRWWATFSVIGLVGVFQSLLIYKKPKFLDILMFASAIAAYIGLIIIPFLSYRYFYPTIIGLIYFSLYAIQRFFSKQQNSPQTTF